MKNKELCENFKSAKISNLFRIFLVNFEKILGLMIYRTCSFVLVIGVCSVDLIGKCNGSFPESNTQAPLSMFVNVPGGNAVNTAIDCAKIGLDTSIVGCVGNDYYGKFLIDELIKHKVNISLMQKTQKVQTGCCIIMHDDNTNRLFFPFKGANVCLDLDKIDLNLLNNSEIVVIQGLFMLPSIEKQLVNFLKTLKLKKKTILVDVSPNIVNICFDDIDRTLREIAPHVDYFVPSENESSKITGSKDVVLTTEILHSKGFYNVIIKCAEKGVFVSLNAGQDRYNVPSTYVKPVDSTGAGDAFMAGFVYGLYKHYSILESLKCGNVLGRECVKEMGATARINERLLENVFE